MNKPLDVKSSNEKVDTGVEKTATIASALTGVLADTYRLVFKTHAYHWNVEGPLFYAIHNLTEEQYEDMFAAADELAERIRAMGELAPARLSEITKASVVEDADELPSAIAMCADLADDHARVAKRFHEVIKVAEDNNDPVTADLATARSAFHEQAAWMLRAISKS